VRNPFAAPAFPRYWLASLAAGTGLGTLTVTVPLYIRDRVELDARGLAIASALVAQTLPGALLALLGGALADRVERRVVLVRTYGVVAGVSTLFAALVALDVQRVWPIFPLAVIVGSAAAFTNPARQSLVPQLVSREQLLNGVIFGNIGYMAAFQFLGPTAAGFTVDLAGLGAAFALEVALLALAAALFWGVRTPPPEPSGASIRDDLRAGVRYVASEPALRGLLLLGTVVGVFFIGPFAVTVPILVPDVFGASDRWVGILWGCFGAGVLLGSIALTLRSLPRRGLAVCLANVSGGIVLCLYSQSAVLWLSALLLVVWGLGASVFMNYVIALLQEHTAAPMMGRVMSMYSLAFFASMPVGYAQAGLVTRSFGAEATLLSSGVVAAVIGVACLVLGKPVRELR
jgi:MFS family permease